MMFGKLCIFLVISLLLINFGSGQQGFGINPHRNTGKIDGRREEVKKQKKMSKREKILNMKWSDPEFLKKMRTEF